MDSEKRIGNKKMSFLLGDGIYIIYGGHSVPESPYCACDVLFLSSFLRMLLELGMYVGALGRESDVLFSLGGLSYITA